jgi:hypothetical protein
MGDPCSLQYKAPSYDRRVFAEVASGFLVPEGRPLPYVVTPSLVLLRPIDDAYRWSLSGSVSGRFGDDASMLAIGARVHRSILSGANAIMPGIALGLGPDLVLAHNGGVDAVVEVTVDLTPLLLGARASWGPITFTHSAFSHPARLETFLGWRIFGWRRGSTALEQLLHQPPPPRRRFRPQIEKSWADDFKQAVASLSLSDALAYLSLVQQVTIRFGAQFDHAAPDCGRQLDRLKNARIALSSRLRQKPDSLRQEADSSTSVRYRSGLEALLREQSEAFATSLGESLAYVSDAEGYRPDPLVLGPAVMHAMNCVLDGALSASCVRVQP